MSEAGRQQAADGKYLTLALGQEEYGIPVLRVREIIKMMDITGVPQVPAHVKGVINLRGKVVPIVDLRLKLGLPSAEYTERTCIIVVEVDLAGRRTMLGVVVDRVSEVLRMGTEDIEPMPEILGRNAGFMKGVAKVKGSVKLLLDLDGVLAGDASHARVA